jgi:hypothetical protein
LPPVNQGGPVGHDLFHRRAAAGESRHARRSRQHQRRNLPGEALDRGPLPRPHADPELGSAYRIHSLYFDTPNNRAYHEKIDGINCRSKVRIRRYFTRDAMWSDWFLEIKSKYHNACVKAHRLAFSDALLADHLLRHGSIRLNELVDEIGKRLSPGNQPAIWSLPLEPKLLVVYDREPLVDPRQARFGRGQKRHGLVVGAGDEAARDVGDVGDGPRRTAVVVHDVLDADIDRQPDRRHVLRAREAGGGEEADEAFAGL